MSASLVFLLLATLGERAPDPPDLSPQARAYIEIHFLAAKRAEAAGDFAQAEEEYESILKTYPRSLPEVYHNLGLVYYLQRKYEAAIEKLSGGIQLKPGMMGARLLLGSSYLSIEQPEKALPHLRYAHKEKATAESATYLGLAHRAVTNYPAANRYFQFALKSIEQKDKILYFIGDSYLKQSERVSNLLAEQYPNSQYDYWMAAKILDNQDWHELAATEYIHAAKNDPRNASIFYPLARLLAILGMPAASQLALERYRQLMPLDHKAALDAGNLPKTQPSNVGLRIDHEAELRALTPVSEHHLPPLPMLNADVNDALGKRLASTQNIKWKLAIDHLLHARWPQAISVLGSFRVGPSDWLRDYLIARAYLWNDDYHKAEEILNSQHLTLQKPPAVQMLRWEVAQQLSFFYFNRLLEEYPQSAHTRFLNARTLDARGKREALEEYQAAIAADPTLTEARIALADYYLSNAKYEEALVECQRALEVSAYSSPAKIRIGRIYIKLRDAKKGIPYLEGALRSDPEDAQARADLARGWELLGETDKAVAEYKRALALDPTLNRLHYVLARIYRKIGMTELADAEYRTFKQNEDSDRTKHLERVRHLRENSESEP